MKIVNLDSGFVSYEGPLVEPARSIGRGIAVALVPGPVAFVPSVPAAFGLADWSVTTGLAAGQVVLNIAALPADGGSAITAIQYNIGAGWIAISGFGTGPRTLTMAAPSADYIFTLRAVSAIGAGISSATKTVTSAAVAAATAPVQFGTNDWSVTTGLEPSQVVLNVSALPSNGGSAIAALQYTINGGATWTALTGTGTGARTLTMAAPGTSYTFAVRAVNAVGNGTASTTKAATSGAIIESPPPTYAPLGYVLDGDSITSGFSQSPSYPDTLGSITGLPFTNLGVGGRYLNTMQTTFESRVPATYNAANRNTLVVLGGVNDIIGAGVSFSNLRSNMTSYINKAKLTNFRLFVGTLLPIGPAWADDWKLSQRLLFNDWIRANESLGYTAIDFAAIPQLMDPTNRTYYVDDLHPNPTGFGFIAEAVRLATGAALVTPPAPTLLSVAPNAIQIMDASTITAANNDPIAAWNDITSNALHVAQATLARRPLYMTAAGLHWVRFDGVDDHMTHPASIIRSRVQSGQPVTIHMAIRATPGTDRRLYAEANTGVEFGQFYGLVQSGASTATGLAHFVRDNGGTIRVPTASVGSAFDGAAHTIAVQDTGTAIRAWIDGALVSDTGYTASTLTCNISAIGAVVRGAATAWFAGDVFAYVINPGGFDANIDTALRTKAGIA